MDDSIENEDGNDGNHQDEIVIMPHGTHIEMEDTRDLEGGSRNAHQPIVSSSHLSPFPGQGVDHHSKRESEHGKVDSSVADAEEAENQGSDASSQRSDNRS